MALLHSPQIFRQKKRPQCSGLFLNGFKTFIQVHYSLIKDIRMARYTRDNSH